MVGSRQPKGPRLFIVSSIRYQQRERGCLDSTRHVRAGAMRQRRKRYLAATAHPMGVRREATNIRSTTSRRPGNSTQALLIQRFEATRGTGHGAGSRPQYNGGSTGRHGSKATHALSSQQAVKPTKPPPVHSTGGSLARRRPARPRHTCHTHNNKITGETIFQRRN